MSADDSLLDPSAVKGKRFEMRDLTIGAAYLALWPLAWILSADYWHKVAYVLAKLSQPFRRNSDARLIQRIHKTIGSLCEPPSLDAIADDIFAGRVEEKLQFLREHRPGGWQPELSVRGTEHIDKAIERGYGCILWIAPLVFSSLLVKRAISESGFEVIHLSRYRHGPADSEFGRRFINVIELSAENRYLADRPMMRSGEESRVLRTLIQALRANRVISIACTHYGRKTFSMPVFNSHLNTATGAPGLAMSTGAALLPLFIEKTGRQRYSITVDTPLVLSATAARDEAMEDVIVEYGQRLEKVIQRNPSCFTKWNYLELPDTDVQ